MKLLKQLRSVYHYLLALWGAIKHGWPGRKIKIVAITGTKGKTSTAEITAAILEKAGYKIALSSTLRFKIADQSERNMLKMTMPGRSFLQGFIRQAVKSGCDWAVIEMTSEGVKQFRHKFIPLDALIFTNLSPEHIESHGSYQNYLAAKLKIASALEHSSKPTKLLIINADDKEASKFSKAAPGVQALPYRLSDAKPFSLGVDWSEINIAGERIILKLPGEFNIYNTLAAATFAKALGINSHKIKEGIESLGGIRGRMEKVGRQDFSVIVDYAHTPDSLTKAYEAYRDKPKICVLGNTGGGRDKWKRPVMAKIAEEHCREVILTNEDPYDEDPQQIIEDMIKGIKHNRYRIILDRREAIATAITLARAGDVVMITGKGTDPYIMGPAGSKLPWDDAQVAHEELIRATKR